MSNSHKRLIRDKQVPKGRPEKYKLDELASAGIAEHLVMFEPSEDLIVDLMARARLSIPGIAATSEVIKVHRHNRHCIMALTRKSKFNPAAPIAEGCIAMLPLNSDGMEILAADAFDATKPDLDLLCGPDERPEGIYWWVVFAPGFGAACTALFMQKLASEQYAGLDIYARTATPEGRNFLRVLGLTEGVKVDRTFLPNLWVFRRAPEVPLYDSYVPHSGTKNIGVTVARSFDDLMKVAAIRNAVYIGEQECPYDEEYDGNDLSATHLLAYIGDEPVGCMRLRFFADFAKFERVAVRKEFRDNRIAIQLTRAALRFCQKKGYTQVMGHVQSRLVAFWTRRFGFKPIEGRTHFAFSDYDYIEMVGEMQRDPDAITLTTDPYVAIRPEGRWHKPGVLERSASRPANAPPVAKKH